MEPISVYFRRLTNIDQRRLNSEAHAIIALIGIDRS
jgi:hypothetical protein